MKLSHPVLKINNQKPHSLLDRRYAERAPIRYRITYSGNIVDVSRGPASAALLGTIPAGAFPRELRISPDGKTLFASNFASKTLQVVDLARLAPQNP